MLFQGDLGQTKVDFEKPRYIHNAMYHVLVMNIPEHLGKSIIIMAAYKNPS
jgi:hypothetical protein